jgi:hypothetical protein
MGAEVAPSVACAVIRTDPREAGDARLDEAPFHREIAVTCFEDDGRLCSAGFARAIKVQAPPADVN